MSAEFLNMNNYGDNIDNLILKYLSKKINKYNMIG